MLTTNILMRMFVCVYHARVCVQTHTHIHIYMHTHTHTHTHTHIFIHTHTHTHEDAPTAPASKAISLTEEKHDTGRTGTRSLLGRLLIVCV